MKKIKPFGKFFNKVFVIYLEKKRKQRNSKIAQKSIPSPGNFTFESRGQQTITHGLMRPLHVSVWYMS
jgi:hypothetical protein